MKPRSKSKIPVLYMLVCIYMVFSAFNLMEDANITPLQKLSYVLLIIVPLGLIVLSVWQRNTRLEYKAFPATALYFPIGLGAALLGLSSFLADMVNPYLAIPVVVVGVAIALLGFNRLRNFRKPTTIVRIDLPEREAAKIAKRLPYERFPKFALQPDAQFGSDTVGANEPAHLLLSRDTGALDRLKEKRRLAGLLGESEKEIPAHFKDPDRCWCGALVNPIAVAVNPAVWQKMVGSSPEPIRSLETLLSPNLTGCYVLPDPERSDAGFLLLAGLMQSLGEEEGLEFMANLKKQANRLLPDPLNVKEIFDDPERIAAVGFLNDFLAGSTMKLKLMLSVPDGAAWELMAAAIPQDSPDQEQSKQFLETLLSKSGNEVFASKALMLPAHPLSQVPFGCSVPEEGGLNPDFDLAKALADREEILRRWRSR